MSRLHRRRLRKLSSLIFIFAIIPVVMFSIKMLLPSPPQVTSEIISPLASSKSIVAGVETVSETSTSDSLGKAVQGALVGTSGSYGVAIESLKSGETYYINEHKSYKSGSLYKLWVMATVYEKIKAGDLSEEDTLSQDIEVLNKKFNIDPEFAERTEGGITSTVKNALTQMITISDNYTALLLTEKIRLSSVASFLSAHGFTESKVGGANDAPVTSPHDIAMYLKQLYKGELADVESTGKMLTLLKNQRLNDKIPKLLPSDVEIAHKTGELDNVTHDAGIVYTSSGDYIIVVLSESNAPKAAVERIQNVSEAVYKYFTSK